MSLPIISAHVTVYRERWSIVIPCSKRGNLHALFDPKARLGSECDNLGYKQHSNSGDLKWSHPNRLNTQT